MRRRPRLSRVHAAAICDFRVNCLHTREIPITVQRKCMETKKCECGCGLDAPISKLTVRRRGWIRGKPKRFVNHHAGRIPSAGWFKPKDGLLRRSGRSPEYGIFLSTRWQCQNGKKGNVRFEFRDFAEFLADVGYRPSPAHVLDRWPSPGGNYRPGNVRWLVRPRNCKRVRKME